MTPDVVDRPLPLPCKRIEYLSQWKTFQTSAYFFMLPVFFWVNPIPHKKKAFMWTVDLSLSALFTLQINLCFCDVLSRKKHQPLVFANFRDPTRNDPCGAKVHFSRKTENFKCSPWLEILCNVITSCSDVQMFAFIDQCVSGACCTSCPFLFPRPNIHLG